MVVEKVPMWLQVADRFPYPIGNLPDFESWFFFNCGEVERFTNRTYLPIFWTAYFKSNKYGKDLLAVSRLQSYIDSLPSDGKFFTIVQFDDGTLIDWRGKDIIIFAMGGRPENSIHLPLVCQPHAFRFNVEKDILFSFIGRITDPIRKTIIDWGKERPDCYISGVSHQLDAYCRILARSKFVLCPRGYGLNSFRCGEAMQYGAIPIVFDDGKKDNWEKQFLLSLKYEGDLSSKDLDQIPNYCSEWGNHWFCDDIHLLYRKWFTFDGVQEIIKKALCNFQ